MKLIFHSTFALLISSTTLFSQQIPLKAGRYDAHLQLNQATVLPVRMTVETSGKQKVLVIHNAEERIELRAKKQDGDTLVIPFPNFDSELRVVTSRKRQLKGFWINYNKANNYRIPFDATLLKETKQPEEKPAMDLTGNWETYFSPGTADQEPAVGIFKQQGSTVTGTFLTETGDYRFLEGTVEGDKFYLSCFDGSHAFLMTGKLSGTTADGNFYSGKHYQTNWKATKNESFKLSNPDSLTFMKAGNNQLKFTLKDLAGKDYAFPNAETTGKVVIIQIMGTWCPNCMDETKYYKELFAAYHTKGLEIISVGYEAADSFAEQAAKIQRLKERHDLGFTFLVGGKANKGTASEQFAMLNEVISFPTTIFIGKDGSVKRIHTGFNGPGTGKYYTEYVEKTNALIESLLEE